MKRILLDRKNTYQFFIDIGLFYLPDNKYTPYVTWTINKQFNDDTANGHYFRTIEEAKKDFNKRI